VAFDETNPSPVSADTRPRAAESVAGRAAIAWFTRRNYPKHRALDPTGLPATFDEWLEYAGGEVHRTGRALRVVIDPTQFSTWCRIASRDTDAAARAAFAQIVAKAARRREWWRGRVAFDKR
jgi:hypothetical protein